MANTISPSEATDLSRPPATVASEIYEQANDLKNKASDYAHKAADAIDEKRMAAAGSLNRAAAMLHDKADNLPGVDKVIGLTHGAAERLSATAGYMSDHEVRGVITEVGSIVKRNPGSSLLAAALAGFLLGRKFSGGARE